MNKINKHVELHDWGEQTLDDEMIPLINSLNEYGIITTQCCSGHGKEQAQVSIDLCKNDIMIYVRDSRLVIQWDLRKKNEDIND